MWLVLRDDGGCLIELLLLLRHGGALVFLDAVVVILLHLVGEALEDIVLLVLYLLLVNVNPVPQALLLLRLIPLTILRLLLGLLRVFLNNLRVVVGWQLLLGPWHVFLTREHSLSLSGSFEEFKHVLLGAVLVILGAFFSAI